MHPTLNVHPLPTHVAPEDLAGGTVVVIDVLRASTTIVHALEAGASEVVPCLAVEEARAMAARLPGGSAVLGGERDGLPIDGFDLGNSPAEYTPDRVKGRVVVFTTSNGTRALGRCRMAERVLIGAFVNASAVSERLAGAGRIDLLCAGARGQYGRDDLLLAGLLVDQLLRQGGVVYRLNTRAVSARRIWRSFHALPYGRGTPAAHRPEPERLARALRDSAGGRNLTAIGRDDDILAAAQIDRFRSVPELDTETLRIRRG
jgi:2-phosphosulfolactate phosphatase